MESSASRYSQEKANSYLVAALESLGVEVYKCGAESGRRA